MAWGVSATKLQFSLCASAHDLVLFHVTKMIGFSFVPQHRVTKHHAEWQVVYQSFQRAGCAIGLPEVRVHPAPVRAMPVAAIVSLHAKSQGRPRERSPVQNDYTGKSRVGVRRTAKAYPAFIAQRRTERRIKLQAPGHGVTVHAQIPPAHSFFDAALCDPAMKGKFSARAQFQFFHRVALNKTPRCPVAGKPGGPDLRRHRRRFIAPAHAPGSSPDIETTTPRCRPPGRNAGTTLRTGASFSARCRQH